MTFSIVTLNINGGCSPLRKAQVKSLVQHKRFDIVLLQETRCSPSCVSEWNRMMKGQWFFSSLACSRAGVAVYLHHSFCAQGVAFKEIIKGHLVLVNFFFNGYKHTILNVYSPSNSTERFNFFTQLDFTLTHLDFDGIVCLIGDFNCTMDPTLDRNGAEPHPASLVPLRAALSKFSFVDVWRLQNPSARQYTWCRCANGRLSLARLDRIYVNSDSLNVVGHADVAPSGFSDHHMVTLHLLSPARNRGAAYWTFNVSLLQNEAFLDAFRAFWEVIKLRKPSFSCLGQWWDNAKAQIRSFCQQYNSFCTKNETAMQTLIAKEILCLQSNLPAQSAERTCSLLVKKKALLADLCAKRARGALIRLRMENLRFIDTSSKFFFGLELRAKRNQQITSLCTQGGRTTQDQSEIRTLAKEYFSDLYCARNTTKNVILSMTASLPTLSESARQQLDEEVTLGELFLALQTLPTGKASGLDGIPAEVYKAFWDQLGPELLGLLIEGLRSGLLPLSCRRAVLALIPKKGDLQQLQNWRPISLLCTDYKIISKTLANRLKSVIGDIVHPDQSYCIPQRTIHDCIFIVRDAIDICTAEQRNVGLVFLDQEKAFDSIDHFYLFAVLRGFGFGETFIGHVKLLYNNIFSLLKVNNILSQPFSVTRGIRQGCPLSGLLYSLSAEPLLNRLRARLQGFCPLPSANPVKTIAYADDLCAFVHSDEDICALVESTNEFTLASSVKVNWQKTKALYLGPQNGIPPPALPMQLEWAHDGVCYLGVFLGTQDFISKNWESLITKTEQRLQKWRGLLRQLSYRGRTLVINNLAASMLWHRFMALQAPGSILKKLQSIFINFFWDGKHWLRPGVISLPIAEGGQGLMDVTSKVMAFRLLALRRLLYSDVPWKAFAHCLLRQAGRLGFGDEIFLLDAARVDITSIPLFYRSMLEAWRTVAFCHDTSAYTLQMFLNEPIFFNPFFKGVCSDRSFVQKFIDVNVTRVRHLRDPFTYRWKPAANVAVATGVRSIRVIGRIFSVISRVFKLTGLKWDPEIEAALPLSQCLFPRLLISFRGFISFNSMDKSSVYSLSVNTLIPDRPAEPRAHWKALLQAGHSATIKWHVMYKEPIVKRSGDLQWRLAHYILPCNVLSHRICSENSESCPFCNAPETIFHAFIECSRLSSLFNILLRVTQGLGLIFTHCVFIYGFSISHLSKSECFLGNFLCSEAKLAIYLSRKRKLQNIDTLAVDVLKIFKAAVTSRVLFEFETHDSAVFEKRWCAKQSLCSLVNGVLVLNL